MSAPLSDTQSLETLRILYPIFKEEVYRRRAAMAQISRAGSLFFLFIAIALIFMPIRQEISPLFRVAASTGVLLVLLLLIYQVGQEKARHEKAKRQLITLEKGFQFFEAGTYLPRDPLYPPEWQDRPPFDQGLVLFIAGMLGTSLLAIFTILLI